MILKKDGSNIFEYIQKDKKFQYLKERTLKALHMEVKLVYFDPDEDMAYYNEYKKIFSDIFDYIINIFSQTDHANKESIIESANKHDLNLLRAFFSF